MKSKLIKRTAGYIKVKSLSALNCLSHKLEIVILAILLCIPVLMAVGCTTLKPLKSTENIATTSKQINDDKYYEKDINCYPGCVGYYINRCGVITWNSCKGFEYAKIK